MEALNTLVCTIAAMGLMSMIALAASIRIVREDTRLSVYRMGRYIGDKGPGLVLLLPLLDRGVIKQVGSVQTTFGRGILDRIGEARTTVYTDGRVLLDGEEWNAMSQSPISAGQRVRVLRIVLEVEKE
jgi:membrane-bound ClpP family serine protease